MNINSVRQTIYIIIIIIDGVFSKVNASYSRRNSSKMQTIPTESMGMSLEKNIRKSTVNNDYKQFLGMNSYNYGQSFKGNINDQNYGLLKDKDMANYHPLNNMDINNYNHLNSDNIANYNFMNEKKNPVYSLLNGKESSITGYDQLFDKKGLISHHPSATASTTAKNILNSKADDLTNIESINRDKSSEKDFSIQDTLSKNYFSKLDMASLEKSIQPDLDSEIKLPDTPSANQPLIDKTESNYVSLNDRSMNDSTENSDAVIGPKKPQSSLPSFNERGNSFESHKIQDSANLASLEKSETPNYFSEKNKEKQNYIHANGNEKSDKMITSKNQPFGPVFSTLYERTKNPSTETQGSSSGGTTTFSSGKSATALYGDGKTNKQIKIENRIKTYGKNIEEAESKDVINPSEISSASPSQYPQKDSKMQTLQDTESNVETQASSSNIKNPKPSEIKMESRHERELRERYEKKIKEEQQKRYIAQEKKRKEEQKKKFIALEKQRKDEQLKKYVVLQKQLNKYMEQQEDQKKRNTELKGKLGIDSSRISIDPEKQLHPDLLETTIPQTHNNVSFTGTKHVNIYRPVSNKKVNFPSETVPNDNLSTTSQPIEGGKETQYSIKARLYTPEIKSGKSIRDKYPIFPKKSNEYRKISNLENLENSNKMAYDMTPKITIYDGINKNPIRTINTDEIKNFKIKSRVPRLYGGTSSKAHSASLAGSISNLSADGIELAKNITKTDHSSAFGVGYGGGGGLVKGPPDSTSFGSGFGIGLGHGRNHTAFK